MAPATFAPTCGASALREINRTSVTAMRTGISHRGGEIFCVKESLFGQKRIATSQSRIRAGALTQIENLNEVIKNPIAKQAAVPTAIATSHEVRSAANA